MWRKYGWHLRQLLLYTLIKEPLVNVKTSPVDLSTEISVFKDLSYSLTMV